MRIVTIGGFDNRGMPIGWNFDMEANKENAALDLLPPENPESVFGFGGIELSLDGSFTVKVGGIEIVEWTEKRKKATEGE